MPGNRYIYNTTYEKLKKYKISPATPKRSFKFLKTLSSAFIIIVGIVGLVGITKLISAEIFPPSSTPKPYQSKSLIDVSNISYTDLIEELAPDSQEEFDLDLDLPYSNTVVRFKNYKIRSGDTLRSIAKRFKLSPGTIAGVNEIYSKRAFLNSKWLMIPDRDGIIYKVKKGDTLQKIANRFKKYHVSAQEIRLANGLDPTDKLFEGLKLFIPKARLPEIIIDRIDPLYAIPLRGRLTSKMGYRKDPFNPSRTEFHPGVDIAAPYGAKVKALAGGVVKFAGWRGGYGKLIIIRHPNGMESYYGHLSKILVSKGQRVKKHQIIGRVGNTGHATGPHLHLEIRKNGRRINPLKLSGLRGYFSR